MSRNKRFYTVCHKSCIQSIFCPNKCVDVDKALVIGNYYLECPRCFIMTDGVVTYDLVHGSVNGEKFIQFLQGKLVPEILPYDGENPRSILVLDNCSIHHVQPVLDTLQQMRILVLFLPPYSPDMNPIEEMYYLKDHDPIPQALNDPVPLIEASFESVTKGKCVGWINHAGYY